MIKEIAHNLQRVMLCIFIIRRYRLVSISIQGTSGREFCRKFRKFREINPSRSVIWPKVILMRIALAITIVSIARVKVSFANGTLNVSNVMVKLKLK